MGPVSPDGAPTNDHVALPNAPAPPPTHRAVLAALGWRPLGSVNIVYSQEAIDAWEQIHRAAPHDFPAVHHLAVMHHARAFDLEQGPRPRESNADWEAALRHWAWLCGCDEFWERLGQFLPRGSPPQLVEAVRRRWPEALLRVHIDLILDPLTQEHRARYHLRLLRSAGFTPDIQQRMLHEVYEARMNEVPTAAWQPETHDTGLLQAGLHALDRYFEFDPLSKEALSDALRLQSRLVNTSLAALVADLPHGTSRRADRLTDVLRESEVWRPRFFQWLSRLDELDPETRGRLCEWSCLHADLARFASQWELAEECFTSGLRVAVAPQDQHRCQKGLCLVRVEVACEQARSGHPGALAACVALREQVSWHAGCCYRLARAFQDLQDPDTAWELCEQVLRRLAEDGPHSAEDYACDQAQLLAFREQLEQERRQVAQRVVEFGSLPVWRSILAARIARRQGRWEETVQSLRTLLKDNPGFPALKTELARALTEFACDLIDRLPPAELGDEQSERILSLVVEATTLGVDDPKVCSTIRLLTGHFGGV